MNKRMAQVALMTVEEARTELGDEYIDQLQTARSTEAGIRAWAQVISDRINLPVEEELVDWLSDNPPEWFESVDDVIAEYKRWTDS